MQHTKEKLGVHVKSVLNQKQKGTPQNCISIISVPQSIIVLTSLLQRYRLDGYTFDFMFMQSEQKLTSVYR